MAAPKCYALLLTLEELALVDSALADYRDGEEDDDNPVLDQVQLQVSTALVDARQATLDLGDRVVIIDGENTGRVGTVCEFDRRRVCVELAPMKVQWVLRANIRPA